MNPINDFDGKKLFRPFYLKQCLKTSTRPDQVLLGMSSYLLNEVYNFLLDSS